MKITKRLSLLMGAAFLLIALSVAPGMAYRDYYADVVFDTSGKPMPSARIDVYLTGTATPANIYPTLGSGTPSNYVISAADGTFSFYLDRIPYGTNQKFDFKITKPGYSAMAKPNIDVSNPVLGIYAITNDTAVPFYLYVPQGVIYAISDSATLSGNICAGSYAITTGTGRLLSAIYPQDLAQWIGGTNNTHFQKVTLDSCQGAGCGGNVQSMTWPDTPGLALYAGGSAWGTSIVDNSTNWNMAYSWGNPTGKFLPIGGTAADSSLLGGHPAVYFQQAITNPVTAPSNITAGTLPKWGASGYTLVDGLAMGPMTDGRYCTYSLIKGLTCTSASGGMVYPHDGGLALYNRSTGTWDTSIPVGTLTDTKYCTYSTAGGISCNSASAGASYPTTSGIAKYNASTAKWDASISDNSSNWNTAYSWGDPAGKYAALTGATFTGHVALKNYSSAPTILEVLNGSSTDGYLQVRAAGYTDRLFQVLEDDVQFYVGMEGKKNYFRNWISAGNNSNIEPDGVMFDGSVVKPVIYTTDLWDAYGASLLLHKHSLTSTPTILSALSNSAGTEHHAVRKGQPLLDIIGGGTTNDTPTYHQQFAKISITASAIEEISQTASPGDIVFSTTRAESTTPSERARILSNGRVGIGTPEPMAALGVVGGISTDTINGIDPYRIAFNDGSNLALIGQARGDLMYASGSSGYSVLHGDEAGMPLVSSGANSPPVWGRYVLNAHAGDTYTFPIGSKTLMATDFSNADVASAPTWNQDTTGLTAPNVPPPVVVAGSGSLTATFRSYVVAGSNSIITLPPPAAGNQIWVRQEPGNTTSVILAALGADKYYEDPSHSGWLPANKMLMSGGDVADSIHLLGLDSSHYLVLNSVGVWTSAEPAPPVSPIKKGSTSKKKIIRK